MVVVMIEMTRGADNAGWEALKYNDDDDVDDVDDEDEDEDGGHAGGHDGDDHDDDDYNDDHDDDDYDDDLHDISVPLSARWARATIEEAEEESVLIISKLICNVFNVYIFTL